MKEFSISDKRYIFLIIGIIYLLLNSMVHGLQWTMEKLAFLNTEGFDFMNAIIILSVCIIYLVFIQYFSFYRLLVLKWLSFIILIFEIAHQTLHYIVPQVNDLSKNIMNAGNLAVQIIWTILILRQTKNEQTGSRILKIYAWTSVFTFFLCVLFFVVILYFSYFKLYTNTFFLFLTLPYFVLLKFAGQLRTREQPTETSST